MSSSITNWQNAAKQLEEIRTKCEALQRGDQPEISDALGTTDIMELFRIAKEIVERCQIELRKNRRNIKYCDGETYSKAKSYARTTASKITLGSIDASREMQEECAAWLDDEQNLPKITVQYA